MTPATPLSEIECDSEVLYFVSDVHLGGSPPADERGKRDRLEAFLDKVVAERGGLFILGDLFDFWFEYRTVVPRTAFSLLARLDTMAREGIPVHYLGGNHDFWMCDFLREETAITVLADRAVVSAQGRRFRLAHGDGLGPGDTGYKILRRVLRNPLAIRMFRWIHPDLGIRLALGSSHASREYTAGAEIDAEGLFQRIGVAELADGVDAFLMGHHHVPVHLEKPEGEFLVLGDWFRRFTYGRLAGGEFELREWNGQ